MTTEDECVEALREAAQRLGESPTKSQYESLGSTPSASTILRVMDGWNDAKEAAGLSKNPSRGPRVTEKPDDVELPDGLAWADLSRASGGTTKIPSGIRSERYGAEPNSGRG